jgi:hypothetical protein
MSIAHASRVSVSRIRRHCRAVPVILLLITVLGAALVGGIDAGNSPRAAAQDTSPTLPAFPGPELCTVEPRSVDAYFVLTGSPVPTPASVVIAAGKPADQTTIDAITTTMIEVAACINTGDLKRLDSLYTESYFFGGSDQDLYDYMIVDHGPPPVEDRYGIFAIALVQVLSDGRVAAIVQFQADGMGGADLMIFAQQDGRYLVDDWVDGTYDIHPDFAAFED